MSSKWFRLRLQSGGDSASRCRCRSRDQVMASVVWLSMHVMLDHVGRVFSGLLLCCLLLMSVSAGSRSRDQEVRQELLLGTAF